MAAVAWRQQRGGVAAAAYQRQSAQLPATPLYPIRHFDMNNPYSCLYLPPTPPAAISPYSARHPHLESNPRRRSPFCFYLLLSSNSTCLWTKITDQNEQISLFFKISLEIRAHLEISLLLMCKAWSGRGCAVCLCVALLDMMRDDIMVDATAASEMRKVPICLPLAKSNVSICHPPQDRTMVFIKINILCTQQYHLFIFI